MQARSGPRDLRKIAGVEGGLENVATTRPDSTKNNSTVSYSLESSWIWMAQVENAKSMNGQVQTPRGIQREAQIHLEFLQK